ncbi:hypothetical protein T492DRAFT_993112 [Pavlovales sp. CCMP2436]|nr:hypothetical protein T492DRAFT_993112 [Pavlovales sp. CCMP2436]
MLLYSLVLLALCALPLASGWVAGLARPSGSVLVAGRRRCLGCRARARRAPSAMLDLPNVGVVYADFRQALEDAGATVVFERGALRILDPDLAAFVGGTVGVVGTVQSILTRRRAVRERLTCVYCDGAGMLMCGVCVGSGRSAAGTPCPNCKGSGHVACVSCQGSGNSVLLASDRNLIRELAGLGTMQDELEGEIDQ